MCMKSVCRIFSSQDSPLKDYAYSIKQFFKRQKIWITYSVSQILFVKNMKATSSARRGVYENTNVVCFKVCITWSSPRFPISLSSLSLFLCLSLSLHTIINFNDLRLYPPGNLIRRQDSRICFTILQSYYSISFLFPENYIIIFFS